MNDDYIWTGQGKPDAEVAQLEKILRPLRWTDTGMNLERPRRSKSSDAARWTIAAAALVLVSSVVGWLLAGHTGASSTSWQLSVAGKSAPVRTGQVIETSHFAKGALRSEEVGTVEIEPESRLRLLAHRGNQQRLALDHGTIHAYIWAPPTQFAVDTPSAKAVDLGCEYTLRVAKNGSGLLSVEAGWVAFQWRNVESFIPAGAACTTHPEHGPDTPFFLDSPEAFKRALAEFDRGGGGAALRIVLRRARPRDGLTLWHLLERTRGDERDQVFSRLAELISLPPEATRKAILNGETSAIDGVWNALDLGGTDWWREWKRRW